ncbi:MAG TPA: 2-oxoglutarate dehydrogenase complex dihydrolipoyllysine-residue succinyltransferase [Pirellulales bacterium]|jgi:2-oxoglutarate dehydrogenase E2 component (dihydrolipoamide succinyltransferase)|nr:2-oxoglutarate dehydrogenase complex dihydrolipoyllysine-residue succinyltransferase [Pirellulales bacterium]
MPVELKVPAVGESITEVQIADWRKGEGDSAEKDESLVEIETDKATVEVSAPVRGRITKVLKKAGESAAVGEVIGYMEEVEAGQSAAPAAANPSSPKGGSKEKAEPSGKADTSKADSGPARVMPAAQRELAAKGLKAEDVQATGPGGRLLKEDVQRHLSDSPQTAQPLRVESPSIGTKLPAKTKAKASPPAASHDAHGREEEVVAMTPLRRRIAERLVEAQHSAALLTTFNEVELSAVMALRAQHKDRFQEKYGVKLGFMSFFVKATIDALKAIPQVNAEIRANSVVYHNYYDIGIAVSSGKGLVVPVLANADRLSFAEIEMKIEDFGRRARENKIKLEELEGGTFTISNGGVFGSLLSTPIVNPPQSGILGLHAIQDRPVAREGQVVIRPMMYMALTYDHRIVDGREAVTFLRRIKEGIEEPARLLLEI